MILELRINFKRTWAYNSKIKFKKGESMKKKKERKKRQKIRRATEGNKIKSTFTCDCNMKS